MKAKLAANFSANFYGQLITVAWQLALVPFFLRNWESSLYGDWLVLFSLPSLLNIMESGLGTVIANEAVMRSAAGGTHDGRKILDAGTSLLLGICALGMLLALMVALLLGGFNFMHLEVITPEQQSVILMILAASVFINLPNSIALGYYRLTDQYAKGVYLTTSFRLAGLLSMAIALVFRQGPVSVALTYLASQVLMGIVLWTDIRRKHRFTLLPPKIALAAIGPHLSTALSFQLFPIGNAVYFHGQTLLVKWLLNSEAVVVFTTTRTLSRVIAQFATLIKHSVWPEFTRLRATNPSLLLGLVRKTTWYVALISVLAGLVLMVSYPLIFRLWTHGIVQVNPAIVATFISAAVLNAVWAIPVGFLQATNLHSHSAKAYALVCTLGLIVSVALCGFMDGILGFGLGMLLSELAMTFVVLRDSKRWLNSTTLGRAAA